MKPILLPILLTLSIFLKAQIPSNGLVAYFPFNGGAIDSSINKTNGTVHGAVLTKDRFGTSNSAYSFDGINDYIEFAGTHLKNDSYSYALWAYLEEPVKNGSINFALAIGDGLGAHGQSINAANNYLGKFTGWQAGGYSTSAPHPSIYTTQSFLSKKWVHIVSIRAAKYVLIYIDGTLVDSLATSTKTTPAYGSNAKGYIGTRDNLSSYFKGSIDEVCIYNRVLTSQEIMQLYLNNNSLSTKVQIASKDISLFPNPSSEKITISNNSNTQQNFTVTFNDLNGKKIYSSTIQNGEEMDVPKFLSNGIYQLVIEGENNKTVAVKKLVVNR